MSPQEAQIEDNRASEDSVEAMVTEKSPQETQIEGDNLAAEDSSRPIMTQETKMDDDILAEDSVVAIVTEETQMQEAIVTKSTQIQEDNATDSAKIITTEEIQVEDDLAEESTMTEQTQTQEDNPENSVEPTAIERQKRRRRGKPKIKLMHESNQTDEERRQIRINQRLLYTKIVEAGDDLNIDQVRGENNQIFSKVYYPREAILDGANMNAIVSRAAQEADRIFKVPRYDADRLVSKLVSKCRTSDGYFDWSTFGTQAGTCFNAMPSKVSFLNGSLTYVKEIKVQQRAKRARIVEEDAQEEQPEDVRGHQDRNADQLSAIEVSLKSMQKTLKQTVFRTYHHNKKKLKDLYQGEIPPGVDKKLKKRGVEIDAIRFLFNPASFTQTVENIFHYSFLVKEGVATLRTRKKGIGDNFGNRGAPGGLACHYVEDATSHPTNTQAIVSLSMQDWRDLIKAYNVKKGDLPYRTGSAQTKSVLLTKDFHESSDSP